MDLQLKGKVAIVTGGTDGIGKASALSLSKEGALVAIVSRNKTISVNKVAAEISSQTGNEVMGVIVDVKEEQSVKELVSSVISRWGKLDILVNNAGTSSASTLEEMTNDQVSEDFQLKVFGAIYCVRHTLPYLKKSKSGSIINITTPGGKAATEGSQPTALSRAAGISLTKSWSKEFSKHNIRVNTICVGIIKSGQHRKRWELINQKDHTYSLEDHWKSISHNVPLGRIGEDHEAGDIIAFLSSDKASYVTGTAINVDGGSSPVV